jgi:uncharacterized protein YbjT (DUF2867 family)
MRIAVAGGTGLAGRQVVDALGRHGHEPVVLSRSAGVDLVTGDGLDAALNDVDAVIDASSTNAVAEADAVAFFQAATANLLAAEQAAGVGLHVALSIVGIDAIPGNAHYAGKRRQEELVKAGPIPYRIVRATQFFDFAETVVGWTRQGDTAVVPPLLVQPIAIADVATVLVEAATDADFPTTIDVAGPQPQDLVDMARRTLAVRGAELTLVPSWDGPLGTDMSGRALLPGPDARIMPTKFDDWLASIATRG